MEPKNEQTPASKKQTLIVKVEANGEIATQLEMDEASFHATENGVVMIGRLNSSGKKLEPADFLQALIKAGVLSPMGPEYNHLPAGVYTTLIQNGCIPLKKGECGGDGVEAYFVSNDPDEAVEEILEAIRGDAWESESKDIAGPDAERRNSITVLWRRVH